ncbi:MAG: hypothetical protein E7459_02340 [Ruminococcaceae bacterium]|nr:hypothetical protein [Oscillospiraceae bacterium]
MPADGYLQVHAYTSDSLIPLEGTAVTILDSDGGLIAARLTDKSGKIVPVRISSPDEAESKDPNYLGQPFTVVSLRAEHPGYEQISVNQVQLFAGVTTLQPLEMIPLSLYPDRFDRVEVFDVPPQNL